VRRGALLRRAVLTPRHPAGRVKVLPALLSAAAALGPEAAATALSAKCAPGGATPLHLAALNKRPLVVAALLEAGADKSATNGVRQAACDYPALAHACRTERRDSAPGLQV